MHRNFNDIWILILKPIEMKYLKLTIAGLAMFAFSQTYAQEVDAKVKKRFEKADTNNDKSISLEELTVFYDGKKTKKGDPFNADKIFAKKDTNEDKKLSFEEFNAKGTAKGKKKGKKKN